MISWNQPGLIPRSHPLYSWILVAQVLLATFLAIFSAAATVISNESIQGDLALSDPDSLWLTTLYLLGVNTTVPAVNWFADRFGYKRIYILGVALFFLGTLLTAFSFTFWVIGPGRLIEGIGAGFIFPTGLAIITQNVEKKYLSIALCLYIASSFGCGFVVGFPLSGYFTEFFSWRSTFYLILPLSVITALAAYLTQEETESKKKEHPFDYKGYIAFALFITALLVALTYGPLISTDEGWRSPFILGSFALALLSLLATLYFESVHPDPLIPLSLFKDPTFTISIATLFLLGMSTFASSSITINYMIRALSYDKFSAGLLAIIYGVALTSFSILSNVLMKFIPIPFLSFAGLSLLVASYYLNQNLDWTTGPEQVLYVLFMRGTAIGLTLSPVTVRALKNIPKELSSKAATLVTFFRQVGATYGGTLISIISIKRAIYHAQRFSEQTHPLLPGYQSVYRNLYNRFYFDFSGGIESGQQAQAEILRNLETQAYITGQNDALIIFGHITGALALLLVILNIYHWWVHRPSISLDKPKSG